MKKSLLRQLINAQIEPLNVTPERVLLQIFSYINGSSELSDLSPRDQIVICHIIMESIH